MFTRLFVLSILIFFFFNDTATTEIYTLSLHDALPISRIWCANRWRCSTWSRAGNILDRKSTRLNSSHQIISYAVFCLKKKKNIRTSAVRDLRRARDHPLACVPFRDTHAQTAVEQLRRV